MWQDNPDGTYTAEKGDTLWSLQEKTGRDWQSFGYEGDPTELQIGEVVGKADNWSTSNYVYNCESRTQNKDVTLRFRLRGLFVFVGGATITVASGYAIEKSGGNAPKELGAAFVLGIKAMGFGTTEMITGKNIIGSPWELFKPVLLDLLKALEEGEEKGVIDMEKLMI